MAQKRVMERRETSQLLGEVFSYDDTSLLVTCCNNNGGLFLIVFSENEHTYKKIIDGDCRGIAKYPEGYVLASNEHGILLLNNEFEVLNRYIPGKLMDYHGVAVNNDKAYIVESALNTIGVFALPTLERIEEIVMDDAQEDILHINDIFIWDNQMYLSMFSFSGNWREKMEDTGVVVKIDLNDYTKQEIILRNFKHPHSIRIHNDKILVCNSAHFEVKENNEIIFKGSGYLRGLAVSENKYYFGQSESRNVEWVRNQKTNISIDAGIHIFDRKEKLSKFISLPVCEVYGLLSIFHDGKAKICSEEMKKAEYPQEEIKPFEKGKIKKLIIHIGTHKTGTTSIQETLGNSQDILKKHGIFYPPEPPFNHYAFSAVFLNNPMNSFYARAGGFQSIEELQTDLNALKVHWAKLFQYSQEEIFVISAENFDAYEDGEVVKLKRFVNVYFDDIKIIVYMRHPITGIISRWEENIKHLNSQPSSEEILKNVKKRYSFTFLESWLKYFGKENVIVRPFDNKALKNGDLIEDFFHSVNIPDININELNICRSNESLGKNVVLFLLEYNKKYPIFKDKKPNGKRYLTNIDYIFQQICSGLKKEKLWFNVKFSEEEADKLNKEINYVNQFLPSGYQFEPVKPSNEKTSLPDYSEIPSDFFVELVNGYSQYINQLINEGNQLTVGVRGDKRVIGSFYALHTKRKKQRVINLFQYIRSQGLVPFDEDFYLKEYPDVKQSGMKPLKHYFLYGAYEGRNPNSNFNTLDYISNHPDIIITGENALLHAIKSKVLI